MSVNITDVFITPNPVSTGQSFVITVTVFDDEFEFDSLATVHDIHQGFADEAQTVGGKFTDAEVVEEYRGITTADGNRLQGSDGAYIRQKGGTAYTSTHAGNEINSFLQEVLGNG